MLYHRLQPQHPTEGLVSVLLHAGCSRGCVVQALVRMQVCSLASMRWVVRSAPPLPPIGLDSGSLEPRLAGPLRAASTVFLTSDRIVTPTMPPALRVPSIRRVYFPPLSLWREYADRTHGDPLGATEVFDALVEDGMPVLDALASSAELAS